MSYNLTCNVNKDRVKVGDTLMVSGTLTYNGEGIRGSVNVYVNGKLWGQAYCDSIGTWFLEKTVDTSHFTPNSENDIHCVYVSGNAHCYTSVYVEQVVEEDVDINWISYRQEDSTVTILADISCYGSENKYISPYFEMADPNYYLGKVAEFIDKGKLISGLYEQPCEFVDADYKGVVYAKYRLIESKIPKDRTQFEPKYGWGFGVRKGDISLASKYRTATIENLFYRPEPEKLQISVNKNTVKPYEDFTITVSGTPYKQVKLQIKQSGLFYQWSDADISPETLDSSGRATFVVHFNTKGKYDIRACYTDESGCSDSITMTVVEEKPTYLTISVDKYRVDVGKSITVYVTGEPNKRVKLQVKYSGLFYKWDDANISPIILDNTGNGHFSVFFNTEGEYDIRVCYIDESKCSDSVTITVTGEKPKEIVIWDRTPLGLVEEATIYNLQYTNLRKAEIYYKKEFAVLGGTSYLYFNDNKVLQKTGTVKDVEEVINVTNYIRVGDNKIRHENTYFGKEDKTTVILRIYADNVTYDYISNTTPPTPYFDYVKYGLLAFGVLIGLAILSQFLNILTILAPKR